MILLLNIPHAFVLLSYKMLEKDGGVSTENGNGASVGDDDDDDAEVAPSEEKFWETADVEKLRNDSASEKSLSVLWEGTQRREEVNKALVMTHKKSKLGMEAILQEDIIQSITVAFQQEFTSIFEKLNLQLVKAFEENTERRRGMQELLEKYEKQWKRQYRKLTACIQDVEKNPEEEGKRNNCVEDDSEKETLSEAIEGANLMRLSENDASPSKDSQASSDEPDWDPLLNQDHTPTVARIRRFLESRDRLQSAEGRFSASCDDILDKIAVTTKDLLHIADDVCCPLHEALDLEEHELQGYLVRNFKRRQALSQVVEDAAKQTQSMYARLMARIKTLAGGSKRKRGTDDLTYV